MKEADWVNATATKTSAEELDPLPLLYQASPVKREGSTKKELSSVPRCWGGGDPRSRPNAGTGSLQAPCDVLCGLSACTLFSGHRMAYALLLGSNQWSFLTEGGVSSRSSWTGSFLVYLGKVDGEDITTLISMPRTCPGPFTRPTVPTCVPAYDPC